MWPYADHNHINMYIWTMRKELRLMLRAAALDHQLLSCSLSMRDQRRIAWFLIVHAGLQIAILRVQQLVRGFNPCPVPQQLCGCWVSSSNYVYSLSCKWNTRTGFWRLGLIAPTSAS